MSHVKIEEESGLVRAESRAGRREEACRPLAFMMKDWQCCTLGAEEAAVGRKTGRQLNYKVW